jgi:transposase
MTSVAQKNLIELSATERRELLKISRQRQAPAVAIERAKIFLALSEGASVRELAGQMTINRKKIYCCLRRFKLMGAIKALKDLPRSGRQMSITVEAKTWVRSLSCGKPEDYGHPHGSWTVDLLQQHVRTTCVSAGHASLSRVSQSTIWEIQNKAEVKPHRITYCMAKRDPDFNVKSTDVLHVYAVAKLIRDAAQTTDREAAPHMPIGILLNILVPASTDAENDHAAEAVLMKEVSDQPEKEPGPRIDRPSNVTEPPAEQSSLFQDTTTPPGVTLLTDANQSIETGKPLTNSTIEDNSSEMDMDGSKSLPRPGLDDENAKTQKIDSPDEAPASKRKKKKHFPYRVASSGLAELVSLLKEQQKTQRFQRLPLNIISYDEKPGIQAIGNKYPDLPPVPHKYPTIARDPEYVRHGKVSLLAGKDLLTGHVHRLISDRHRSKEFVQYLQHLDSIYPKESLVLILLDNHSAHVSKETVRYLDTVPDRFRFVFTPVHSSWLNTIECFFSKMSRSVLRRLRVSSKAELTERIEKYLTDLNESPKVFRWKYGLDKLLAA